MTRVTLTAIGVSTECASEGAQSRRGVVGDGYKLVEDRDSGTAPRLYRLPDESTDVAGEEPERAQALRRSLEQGFAALAPPPRASQTELLPEELEGLRAMGYLERPEAP
jgi:hypothetical protein